MRKKFKIYYCKNHQNTELAGKEYKVGKPYMLTMNNNGIFFVYDGEQYYPSIAKLSDRIGNYDVEWIED